MYPFNSKRSIVRSEALLRVLGIAAAIVDLAVALWAAEASFESTSRGMLLIIALAGLVASIALAWRPRWRGAPIAWIVPHLAGAWLPVIVPNNQASLATPAVGTAVCVLGLVIARRAPRARTGTP
jgi:hypothetical protein